MTNQIDNLNYNVNKVSDKRGYAKIYRNAYLLLVLFSLLATIIILLDTEKPDYYGTLFLLPIAYIILLLINFNNLEKIANNFGVIMIFALEFIRLVVSPIFLVMSDYYEVITLNVAVNTPKAIGLLFYEAIIIAIALKIPVKTKKEKEYNEKDKLRGIKRLHIFMAVFTVLIIITSVISPQILLAHRTFLGAFIDKNYTSVTFDSIIASFPTGIKHYSLMFSRLLLAPYRLMLPAYLIVVIRHKYKRKFKWLSWLLSFFPLLMVSDVIAQSLYFTMFLLLMNCFMDKVSYKKIILVFAATALAVLAYFCGRYLTGKTDTSSFINDFARKSVIYFSGLNIVSGSFNQPVDLVNKYQYFLYDFLTAIPFNKTLLGLDSSITTADLFNSSNQVLYQIPTTIGMCNYYFGFVLAPLYSFFLAYAAKRNGEKILNNHNPLLKMVYMFAAFIFSLGLVMYNIEIALTTLVQVVLPLYVIIKISYRRKNSDT